MIVEYGGAVATFSSSHQPYWPRAWRPSTYLEKVEVKGNLQCFNHHTRLHHFAVTYIRSLPQISAWLLRPLKSEIGRINPTRISVVLHSTAIVFFLDFPEFLFWLVLAMAKFITAVMLNSTNLILCQINRETKISLRNKIEIVVGWSETFVA